MGLLYCEEFEGTKFKFKSLGKSTFKMGNSVAFWYLDPISMTRKTDFQLDIILSLLAIVS